MLDMDQSSATQPPVALMRGIVKEFPGVRALNQVEFSVCPGELRGLVGKNGAGKSTLMNVLTGVYPMDAGEIVVDGKSFSQITTGQARDLGIAYVHQHSQLVPPLSIAENIFCGRLPVNKLGVVDWPSVNRVARERLGQFGLDIDVTRKIEGLSVAERQVIEIAKALFADARVIILDEATAPLPKSEVELLFGFVRRQRDRGVAFIYISHYLEEIFELCDTVTVMRDGKNVGDYAVSDLKQADLIRLISGAEVQRFRHAERARTGVTMLEIAGLTREGAYTDLDLRLEAGEIVGLTGLEGCGKDALARGLFGLEPLGDGAVTLDYRRYHASDPRQAFDRGVAYLPRDRHGFGIMGNRAVRENVTLPILRRLANSLGLILGSQEKSLVADLIQKLNIKTPSMEQSVQFLSGGNQQKVVFAKLTSTRPKLLLLDEPTQGVDVQAKTEIMKIIDHLAQEGVAVVVISEEIRELLDICDRIVVMFGGRVVTEFDVDAPSTDVASILSAVEGTVQ
jgi:ABC-type sugar transport system ATPase subunit